MACFEEAVRQSSYADGGISDLSIADLASQIVTSQLLSLHCGRSADMLQLTTLQVKSISKCLYIH